MVMRIPQLNSYPVGDAVFIPALVNHAQGKTATASSTAYCSSASNSNDGNYQTSWVASSNSWPAYQHRWSPFCLNRPHQQSDLWLHDRSVAFHCSLCTNQYGECLV
ncbi:hypothetical protein J2T19_004225 [Paenibacillus tundrae]|uniref:Uncharacterized protein n=1 Tax=Paenibacillus tundrae TaxID=528187 RepID=A0ABT9WHH6_9BACL|nr:hypothetical protein [Paenibacillus tundrae]